LLDWGEQGGAEARRILSVWRGRRLLAKRRPQEHVREKWRDARISRRMVEHALEKWRDARVFRRMVDGGRRPPVSIRDRRRARVSCRRRTPAGACARKWRKARISRRMVEHALEK